MSFNSDANIYKPVYKNIVNGSIEEITDSDTVQRPKSDKLFYLEADNNQKEIKFNQ